MNYLLDYGFNEEQIKELKERYNDSIIKFITENQNFITEKIEYLRDEGITKIYELMMLNIRIFLETTVALKNKMQKIKEKKLSPKSAFIILSENIKL